MHETIARVAEITAVKGGQQALLAQWTAAATESRQGRDEVVRLATALADRESEIAALRGAGSVQGSHHCTVVVDVCTRQQTSQTSHDAAVEYIRTWLSQTWVPCAGVQEGAQAASEVAVRAADELRAECARLSAREAELLASQQRLGAEAAAEVQRLRQQAASVMATVQEDSERATAAARLEADALRQQVASLEASVREHAASAASAAANASQAEQVAGNRLQELEAALYQKSEEAEAERQKVVAALVASEQGRRDAEASAVLAIQGQQELQARLSRQLL